MASDDVERHIEIKLQRKERKPRLKDKDLFEVVEEVFDRRTVLAVIELKRRGCIKQLKGVISAGKEARVYWAKGPENNDLAVKIYLTVTAEFRKSIWKYIRGDPRYEWIGNLPRHRLIMAWARKEFSNLKRMYSAGVRVPKPICFYQNVLVMEFIGKNGIRAPLLKEAIEWGELEKIEEAERVFWDIVENIRIMYRRAGLVHADLSEYNIMLWNGEPYIIDVSQAVRIDHPYAHSFLYRDVYNIVKFFSENLGLDIPSVDEIYEDITSSKANEIE